MKSNQIGYLTEISKTYTKGINKCNSFEDLKSFLFNWKEFTQDAIEQMGSEDFSWDEYMKGVKIERRGKYSGDKWAKNYSAILLPKIILFIGLKAQQMFVPEGALFIRVKDLGLLKKDKAGYFQIVESKSLKE